MTKNLTERLCRWCGRKLPRDARWNRYYCNTDCKNNSHNYRKKHGEFKEPYPGMSPEDEVFSVKKGAIETYAQWKQEDPELYANYVARINATVKAADILDHSPTQGNFQTYEKLARPLNLEWQKERLLRKHAEIGKSLSTLLEERCEPIPDCGCGMWDGLADAELADAGEV